MSIRVLLSFTTWLAMISLPAFGGVTLSPAHTNISYNGIVKLTASVSKGASADIDIFYDNNQNGSIDTGEIVMRHYKVTDGQQLPPTGALLVTDTDGLANGSVVAPILNFSYDDRIAGRFVVRVKSGTSTSQVTFINDPPSTTQSVSGQLLLGGTGKAGAAFLLNSGGEMLYPILTDASGRYTLPVPSAGSYKIGGVVINEAGRLNSGVAVTITAGQKKTGVNVSLAKAPYRLKGKVIRSDTNQGVPYAWLDADCDTPQAWVVGVADSSGNFDIGISNGAWAVKNNALAQLGFMKGVFADGTNLVTVNGVTITGKNFFLTPIAGFASGRAWDATNKVYLAGAKLVASTPGTYDQVASVLSDQNGYWALGLAAGQWDIYAGLDTETDLYKTMLYPSAKFTKTIAASQAAQSVGTINFLKADGNVSVKIVDSQNHPQKDLYVYGCDQGISNSYQSNAGPTDSNGMVSVPVRRNNTWFVGVNLYDQRICPPQHRLDVLAQDGNVIKVYPLGYRKRPYRVYGGNSAPSNTNYPQDSGYKLLGKAAGTATFAGTYPYYCIVAYEGEALIDSLRGFNGVWYGATSSSKTLNAGRIAGKQDGLYATVGDQSGQPAVGSVYVRPGTTLGGITVIHPDEPYNGAQGWRLYDSSSAGRESEWSSVR